MSKQDETPHPTSGTWSQIRLMGEWEWRKGPWIFVAFGTIGAYPGFVNGTAWVPLHGVAEAKR